jgi:hypothetical protein
MSKKNEMEFGFTQGSSCVSSRRNEDATLCKGKKTIKIRCLLLLLLLYSTQIFSQELFTKKLQWTNQDSIEILTFQSKNKIIEWSESFGKFAFVQSREFCMKNNNIFILMVDGCSGMSCLFIYVFKKKDNIWELQTTSQARLKEQLKVRTDNEQEKIIFEINSGQIGELSFKCPVMK